MNQLLSLRSTIPAELEERKISDELSAFELYTCWGVDLYKRKMIVKNRRERLEMYKPTSLYRKARRKKELRKYSNGIWWRQLPF